MSPLEITLVILLVTIIAFVSGKVPFSVISTGIILALILTGIKTPAEAFGGFINTNVVMFVAMFVIGAGLTKTPLIDKAQSLVIRYKDNMRMLIFLSCVAGAFLGAITSATATAAIMIPLLVGIANDIGVSRSKLLYPSMACANIATQMTFLGQGASNMAWNDVMMQAGAPTPLHIWDFTIARIPMLTIAILYMTFVGYKLMPDIPNEQFSDAAHTASESEKLSPFKRKLAVLIVLVSIAMMLLENVIGVKMYLTSCIGAAALVLTGVLTEREALNSIHQPTIFLFAGVLALSDAIQTTGAGDVVADWMIRLLGDTTNPYIIMLVFFLVPFILTQVMSNLATLTIFIPLVTSACIRMGVDPRAAVVGVITASCVNNKLSKFMNLLIVFSMVVPFQMVMFTLSKTADRLNLNNPWNICIIYLGFGAGLAVFMFTGFMKSVPMEIEEAAMIDGCNPIQIFFKVVFPILKPTMIRSEERRVGKECRSRWSPYH